MGKIINAVAGTRRLQHLFESLFYISIRGLNYGNGGNFKTSGELNVLKFLSDKFRKEASVIIFDVGANVGNYSKALTDVFNSKATIHAFEPSKKTYSIFLETTKNSQYIIPNNIGFSDTESSQLLYTDADASGLASIYHRKLEHLGISMDKSEEVQLTTIDAYCTKNNIDRIHFLKLDIEGHELKALNGAKQMIANKQIDVIQFEFGGSNIDSRTYFQDFYYLLKDNYKIYRILRDGLLEIPVYKETHELFQTINYLSVKK